MTNPLENSNTALFRNVVIAKYYTRFDHLSNFISHSFSSSPTAISFHMFVLFDRFSFSKFSNLTCFDHYLAVAKCTNILRDQKAKQPKIFGLVMPTPTLSQLEFLYDLFELSGDVHGLLDFVAYLLMPSEEDISTTQLPQVKTVVGTLPTKSVVVVAMLRKYHACLMLLPEHTTRIFRG